MDAGARRKLGAAGLAWFLLLAAAVSAWFVFAPLRGDVLNNDLTLTYMAGRIGLDHGWSHIYSLDLQQQLFSQLRPGASFTDGERFISLPPLAWLALPVTVFGPAVAFYIWLALSLVALVAAWWLAAPGADWTRSLWLLGALAWYPVLYSLSFGQPVMIVLLAVVGCWRLAEAGKPYLAGLVLAGAVVKPQLMLLVPAVLLVAGHWRIAAVWALATGILVAASVASLGIDGIREYRSLAATAQASFNNNYFTLAFITGPGLMSYLAEAAVALVGLVGAHLNRRAGLARLFALGLVTSTLAATYWHLQDFAILVGAAWLFSRHKPPVWQRLWLLVVVVAAELAWPLRPLPLLIAVAVWLAFLVFPARDRGLGTAAEARPELVPA